jgi:hypothetical protein
VEQKLRIGISYKIANKIHKICVAAGEEGRAASLQGKKERRGLDPAPFDSVRSGGGDGDHVADGAEATASGAIAYYWMCLAPERSKRSRWWQVWQRSAKVPTTLVAKKRLRAWSWSESQSDLAALRPVALQVVVPARMAAKPCD